VQGLRRNWLRKARPVRDALMQQGCVRQVLQIAAGMLARRLDVDRLSSSP
jgi:hypothetical protein